MGKAFSVASVYFFLQLLNKIHYITCVLVQNYSYFKYMWEKSFNHTITLIGNQSHLSPSYPFLSSPSLIASNFCRSKLNLFTFAYFLRSFLPWSRPRILSRSSSYAKSLHNCSSYVKNQFECRNKWPTTQRLLFKLVFNSVLPFPTLFNTSRLSHAKHNAKTHDAFSTLHQNYTQGRNLPYILFY